MPDDEEDERSDTTMREIIDSPASRRGTTIEQTIYYTMLT